MPHDGLDDGASTTVMQAIVGTGALGTETASPQWSRAAPTCADVVFHHQAVLNHISIGPNGLMRIPGQHVGAVADKEVARVTDDIVASCP